MKLKRRGALATTAAAALLVSLGWTTAAAPSASADIYTPGMPTIDITLPAGVEQGDLDGGSKDTVYTQTKIAIDDPTDAFDYTTPLSVDGTETGEIKGRGNYTWTLAKKPYQFKLDASRDVLGMGAGKTWILLANHADMSLMRNKIAYDLGATLGLAGSPASRWVDLKINGKYRGNYLLTEKVEVKKNRVELVDPQGILVELDHRADGSQPGYPAEDYWFHSTTSNSTFALKDSKSGTPAVVGNWDESTSTQATKAGWDAMKATLNELDRLLYQSTPNWAAISAIIDVDSFVKYYFVFEMAENPEITQSSVYFYKDAATGKLFAGPVWDFDSALGNYDKTEPYGADYRSEYVKNAQALRAKGNGWQTQLFRNQGFVERANQLWQSGIAYHVSQLPAKIDGYQSTVSASAVNNFAKWNLYNTSTLLVAGQGHTYPSSYSAEVSLLKTWVTNRQNMLRKLYGNDVAIVRSRGYVQSKAWLPYVNSGQIVGTTGLGLRLEGMNLAILNSPVTGTITANSHVQSIGWSGYKTIGSSTLIGTTGKALRMEAIQFKLTGNLATKYVVSYRAHVQGIGWQAWKSDGATAGTTGQAKRIEAVQVRLVLKTVPTPTAP